MNRFAKLALIAILALGVFSILGTDNSAEAGYFGCYAPSYSYASYYPSYYSSSSYYAPASYGYGYGCGFGSGYGHSSYYTPFYGGSCW